MSDMNREEVLARAAFATILNLCRPHVDHLRDTFTQARYEANGDEFTAFTTLTKNLQVLVEKGQLDMPGAIGMIAFCARRLSYHQPMLAGPTLS